MAALVGGVALLGLAPPASAAPGDAAGTALRIDLEAGVGVVPGLALDVGALLGSVTAPPDDSVTGLGVAAALAGATGLTASNGVVSAAATSGATGSEGTSEVDGLLLELLGVPTSATVLAGTATCPVGGAPVAAAEVTDLSVLGQTITATVPGATVTVDAAVASLAVVDARLVASVTTDVETTTATTATARALQIDLQLTATVAGLPVTVPLGQVVAGEASCTTPAVAPPVVAPTAVGLTPTRARRPAAPR
ncbi:hypothetical protein ACFQX8_11855 [Klenkia terrae]|uniref:hypothetical protein n=1 Tax=Klenkia terrae TaxID=1052259 RepID=UPI003622BCA8